MEEFRNASGKRVCDVSLDRRVVVICVKGCQTVITANPDGTLNIQNVPIGQAAYRYSGSSPLASRIVCGDCGAFYGPKVWHSNSKYRRTIWQCNGKFKGAEKCSTPHLVEEDIKARFLVAFNELLGDRNNLLEDCRLMQHHLTDCSELDAQINELVRELEVVTGLTRQCVEENASSAQDQNEYAQRYDRLVERYETTRERLEELQKKRDLRCSEADAIGAFMFELMELDEPLVEFDDHLWLATVSKATVQSNGKILFTFRNGTEVTA